jgi:5'-nucleotidase
VPNFGVRFGRIDLTFDTVERRVAAATIHEPQHVCGRVDAATGECAIPSAGVAPVYEGRPVVPSAKVAAAIEPELKRVRALRAERLGITAITPIARAPGAESALGNLYADALRAVVADADVALSYGPGRGGLRADLPAAPLTFGDVYDVFPFDNRVARVEITGAQLARMLSDQLPQLRDGRRGLLSISGIRVMATCGDDGLDLRLQRDSGAEVLPTDKVVVAAASYSAGRAAWAAVENEPAVEVRELPLLVRDAVAAWLLERGGHIAAADFVDPARPRWRLLTADPLCNDD